MYVLYVIRRIQHNISAPSLFSRNQKQNSHVLSRSVNTAVVNIGLSLTNNAELSCCLCYLTFKMEHIILSAVKLIRVKTFKTQNDVVF